MPTITLPDNSTRKFDNPLSIDEIAKDIGPGLAKATVAGKINGNLVDAKSGKTFEVVNPSDGNLIVNVPDLDVNDARIAIDAAYEAFPNWSKKTAKDRSIILNKFCKLMLENADDLAAIPPTIIRAPAAMRLLASF